MSRKRTLTPRKKIALLLGAVVLGGGSAATLAATSQAASTSTSQASSVVCDGLATARANNEGFIAAQRANPDAQSEARIANREAVIEEIKRKQEASGCSADASDDEAAAPEAEAPDEAPDEASGAGQPGAVGDVVCAGSTVTLSGEGGAPAASSNQFPAGTELKVTNLDNDKSITVEVTSASGSCVLLNDAAFEEVREAGKFLIRNARIERVG
ncbi:RlpA-like double-psi beta-barrel domain-containing protein [Streptomyces apocyni]|uniref:hypothetical protein n=1 Tax=Streptomyces apocyni TaxID=2654677 RepID=UPI0012EA941C|nr:hypothetical protein [Streptomyces apocyni]